MTAAGTAFIIAAITVGLAGAVGYGLYKVISKKGQAVSTIDHGRKWLAWTVFIGTLTTLPSFFRNFDADSFAKWILVVVFYGGVAFIAGCIYGTIFGKRPEQEAKEDTLTLRSDAPKERVLDSFSKKDLMVSASDHEGSNDAVHVLKLRLAHGEISQKEYREILSLIVGRETNVEVSSSHQPKKGTLAQTHDKKSLLDGGRPKTAKSLSAPEDFTDPEIRKRVIAMREALGMK